MMRYNDYSEDLIEEALDSGFSFCQWPEYEDPRPRAKDWMHGRYKITGRHKGGRLWYLLNRLDLPEDYPPPGWIDYVSQNVKE